MLEKIIESTIFNIYKLAVTFQIIFVRNVCMIFKLKNVFIYCVITSIVFYTCLQNFIDI